MTALLILALLMPTEYSDSDVLDRSLYHVAAGTISFYNPGVMERVARYRGLYDKCQDCVGYAATVEPGWLGKTIFLLYRGHLYKLLVVDVANRAHRANLQRRGRIAEVDYNIARQLNMAAPINATLWRERTYQ